MSHTQLEEALLASQPERARRHPEPQPQQVVATSPPMLAVPAAEQALGPDSGAAPPDPPDPPKPEPPKPQVHDYATMSREDLLLERERMQQLRLQADAKLYEAWERTQLKRLDAIANDNALARAATASENALNRTTALALDKGKTDRLKLIVGGGLSAVLILAGAVVLA